MKLTSKENGGRNKEMVLTKKDLQAIEQTLVPKLEKVLVPKLEKELVPRLEAVLVARLEAVLVPRLEASLIPKLEAALLPKIENRIIPKVESLISELRSEMMKNFDALFKKFEMLHEENVLFRMDIRSHNDRINLLEQRVTRLEARA
jgi:hypothetical protein